VRKVREGSEETRMGEAGGMQVRCMSLTKRNGRRMWKKSIPEVLEVLLVGT
jgi:hypothetical protein